MNFKIWVVEIVKKRFAASSMIPVFMSVQNVGDLEILKVSVKKLENDFWICGINEDKFVRLRPLDHIRVVILEQWYCKDPV